MLNKLSKLLGILSTSQKCQLSGIQPVKSGSKRVPIFKKNVTNVLTRGKHFLRIKTKIVCDLKFEKLFILRQKRILGILQTRRHKRAKYIKKKIRRQNVVFVECYHRNVIITHAGRQWSPSGLWPLIKSPQNRLFWQHYLKTTFCLSS
jgi:hypothetical protein